MIRIERTMKKTNIDNNISENYTEIMLTKQDLNSIGTIVRTKQLISLINPICLQEKKLTKPEVN